MNGNGMARAAAGALFCCMGGAAQAGSLLSGAYALSSTDYCQPQVQVNYDGTVFLSQIGGIGLGGPQNGEIQVATGTITFDASTQRFSSSSGGVDGSAVEIFSKAGNGTVDNTQGEPLAASNFPNGGGSYSAGAETVKLGGISYKAAYGKISGGIAQYAALVGLDSNGCANRIELNHK